MNMKRLYWLRVICAWAILGLLVSCASRGGSVVYRPIVYGANIPTLLIESVSLSDTSTMLTMKAKGVQASDQLMISPDAQIISDDVVYSLKSAQNIIVGERYSVSSALDTLSFELHFEAIPQSAKNIDFRNGAKTWIIGIDLVGTSSRDLGVPTELLNPDLDVPMPTDTVLDGTSVIRIHALGLRKWMPRTGKLYVSDDCGKQKTYDVKLDEAGEALLTIELCNTADLLFCLDNEALAVTWAIPGESIDVYIRPVDCYYSLQSPNHLSPIYTNGRYAAYTQAMSSKECIDFGQDIINCDSLFVGITTEEKFQARLAQLDSILSEEINISKWPRLIKEINEYQLTRDKLYQTRLWRKSHD